MLTVIFIFVIKSGFRRIPVITSIDKKCLSNVIIEFLIILLDQYVKKTSIIGGLYLPSTRIGWSVLLSLSSMIDIISDRIRYS